MDHSSRRSESPRSPYIYAVKKKHADSTMDRSSYRSESPRSPPSSSTGPKAGGWRSAALAQFAKVKDYVASNEMSKSAYAAVSNRVTAYRTGVDPVTGEKRQTWEEWARERRQRSVPLMQCEQTGG